MLEMMRFRRLLVRGILHTTIAGVLAGGLVLAKTTPAAAIGIETYFSFTTAVSFNKTSVQAGEEFNATVIVQAICNASLPVAPSEGFMSGRVIARHDASGTEVVLNPLYSVTISPVPYKKGDTITVSKVVSLQFPQGSQSGTYTIVGELIEAKIKIGLWFSVKDYLPSSQVLGSVAIGSPGYGGGGDGSSGGTSPGPIMPRLPPGTTEVSKFLSANGTLTASVIASSVDGRVRLTLGKGTRMLTAGGAPPREITVVETKESTNSTGNLKAVGAAYDLGPDGAVFDPPATLTLSYSESDIPAGVAEGNLTVAFWNRQVRRWEVVENPAVDTEADTVTVSISHFTLFAVTADTSLASLTVSDLSVSPGDVGIGEPVSISALVSNRGGLAGTIEVEVRINGAAIFSQKVELPGGGQTSVNFVTTRRQPGVYAVEVAGLPGEFTVRAPASPLPSIPAALTPTSFAISTLSLSPQKAAPGEQVLVAAVLTNRGQLEGVHIVTLKIDGILESTREITLAGGTSQAVTFVVTRDRAGSYAVAVDSLSGTLYVEAPAVPVPKRISRGMMIGSASGGLGLVLLAVILFRRRRAPTLPAS